MSVEKRSAQTPPRTITQAEAELLSQRWQNITDNVPGVVFRYLIRADGTDCLEHVSQGAEKIWGISAEAAMANVALVWNRCDPEDLPGNQASILHSAQTLTPWIYEWRFHHPDGSMRWHQGRGQPMRLADGGTIWDSIVMDITVQKEAQQQLQQALTELNQHVQALAISNRDLEQFAYIASHDLQEPLRMISSFLSQLEKKYSNLLDDKGRRYIHFAVDGAQRMRQIILDLLEYSRLSKTGTNDLESVNLNQLMHEIKLLLRKKIQESDAQLHWQDLPTLQISRTQARQLFQNLIDNALKYARPEVRPEVRLEVQETEQEWVFSVADNGLGIETEYFDKIFVIFQRLHPKEQFSGTGIGLAICKKIVESLGGRIWLDSRPAEGSCFYFSLKK
ncbi:MAG: hypothetical protein CVV27_05920 [Candidatus Melainabacteria bacterium HGW-Melainabacteria-1]|nr:MAG: hypothetical protein CVV27_05920 [Candidatus Melainabacteria bacterium HGW-Melainabacteria-1]